MTTSVPILWREGCEPFAGRPRLRRLPVIDRAPTVAEIVAGIEDLPPWFWSSGIVCIDGRAVPREMWAFVRPQPSRDGREIVVSLHTPVQGGGGGGGGGKSPWSTVAMIAIVAATLWVGGGGLAGTLGGAFAAGKIGAVIGAASISIAGQLAVAALTPTPSFDDTKASAAEADTAKSASLSGNVLRPGGAVPRVIGTSLVYPPLAAQVLTEIVEDDEQVEAVFVLAGPHTISDVLVDGTPASQLDNVAVEIHEGFGSAARMSLLERYAATAQPNITLRGHSTDDVNSEVLADQANPGACVPVWTSHLCTGGPDEIWLDLSWQQGLFRTTDPNESIFLPVRVRMRPRGGSDADWRNLPELHFHSNRPNTYRKSIRIVWGRAPESPTPKTARAPFRAYTTVPAQGVTGTTGGWTASSHFHSGSGATYLHSANVATTGVRNVDLHRDKAVLHVGGTEFPEGVDWEVQIIAGHPVRSTYFTVPTYVYSSAVYDFFGYRYSESQYVILSVLNSFQWLPTLNRVARVWRDPLVPGGDFAVIQLRARGQTISRVGAVAAGYVRDWDATSRTWSNWITTSNPAPHYRDVLAGDLAARRVPEAIIDDDVLVDWRQHCIDNSYAVSAVVEGRASPDVLSLIAAAGYARPRQSETWGVIVDHDRSAESPVQHFSARTTRGLTFEKAFAALPDGLRVRYRDETADYGETETIVMAPWAAGASSLLLEDISYDGLSAEASARARAAFDLAQMLHRMTFYAFDAPVSALVCRRGDLVGVTSDVLDRQTGGARIKSIIRDGGDVIALTLDGTVPTPREDAWTDIDAVWSDYDEVWEAPRHGLAITLTDGTSVVVEVTAPDGAEESATLALVDPLSDPGTVATPTGPQARLAPDCHVVAGPLGAETRRMIVHTIMPKSATEFSLRLVDEAPQLWA
ncbi:hypothetical protein [Blastochloris tepida]|uniref:Tip attachment protein J domain-containing protein n=1 Tax=Blastochloris tepida TaxID=2233851 RepID=A0A348G1F5_9HYPH|nr:hypothetical protein [Blastochloris tepida]BBF93388.1 hypothetical protein BLTE_20730 [Blastochloris tepida]